MKLQRYDLVASIRSVRRGDADGVKIMAEYRRIIKEIVRARLNGIVYCTTTRPRVAAIRFVESYHCQGIYSFVTPYPEPIIEECMAIAWSCIAKDVEEKIGYAPNEIMVTLRAVKVERWPRPLPK